MALVQAGRRRPLLLAFGLLLGALLLLGWLGAEKLLADRQAAEQQRDVEQRASALAGRLGANLRADLQAAKGLVSLIHLEPALDQARFERAARPLFGPESNLRNVAAAPDLVIRLMAPLNGNERALGLDYRKVPAQLVAIEWARIARQTVVAGPVELVQGGQALIARLPVYLPGENGKERFWGVVSAVIDLDKLYASSGLSDPDLPLEVALRGRDAAGAGGEAFHGRPQLFGDAVLVDIDLPLGSWQMAVAPKGGWQVRADGAGTVRALFALVALVVLGALVALDRSLRTAERAQAQATRAQLQMAELVEGAPDAMLLVDGEGLITLANAQAEQLFGWPRVELLGRSVEMLLPEPHRHAHRDQRRAYLDQAQARGMRPATELAAVHRDGRRLAVEIGLSPLIGEDRRLVCAVVRDITERRAAEQALRRSERRLRGITDNLPVLIAQFDAGLRFVFANATYQDWYGLEVDAMLGRELAHVFPGPAHAPLCQGAAEALAQGDLHRFVVRDGEGGQARHLRVTCVPERGDHDEVVGLFLLAQDISDLKAVEQRLTELARHDHLSGLLNRRSFDEELERALARSQRQGRGMALMYVDADHFKDVNDQLGHAAGDTVLKALAERMRAAVRETDTVARLGGDEFAIILEPMADFADAQPVVDKITRVLREPIATESGPVHQRVSIGLAWLAAGDLVCTPKALMEEADAALYEAKEGGRNRHALRRFTGSVDSAG